MSLPHGCTSYRALDRAHRVTKMIGNGMRPNIWGNSKSALVFKEVLELYASSEGNVGFSNIFNFDNTVGFSYTHMQLLNTTKKNELVRIQQGYCKKVKTGQVGLLVGKITSRSPFDGYTDPEKQISYLERCLY